MTITAQNARIVPTSPNPRAANLLSLWKTFLAELLCRTSSKVN